LASLLFFGVQQLWFLFVPNWLVFSSVSILVQGWLTRKATVFIWSIPGKPPVLLGHPLVFWLYGQFVFGGTVVQASDGQGDGI